jgi:hypothetical protein
MKIKIKNIIEMEVKDYREYSVKIRFMPHKQGIKT